MPNAMMGNRRATPLSGIPCEDKCSTWNAGVFFESISKIAISEFESLGTTYRCQAGTVLFAKQQESSTILLLREGGVKLSLNSSAGERHIIGMARPGEILGLTSVVSGLPYQMTAESQFLCTITQIPRPAFLDFLIRYPVACMNVARQLSLENKRACDQLHILGLTLSAPRKLACLLLEWCADSDPYGRGTLCHCSLTHGEIGEYIGVSRETVTRALTDFKARGLIQQHGAILITPDRRALANFAGQGEDY